MQQDGAIWIEIDGGADLELVEQALFEAGALGIEEILEPFEALPGAGAVDAVIALGLAEGGTAPRVVSHSGGVEPRSTGRLRAWFSVEDQSWRALLPVDAAILAEGFEPQRDWDRSWRERQEPLPVGDELVVVPPWLPSPENAPFILRMEAKQAFGTGGHESTRLAVRLLGRIDIQGLRVLDIGAGTGILGFHALQRGAGSAVLFDIDPVALPCLAENASLNDMRNWQAFAGPLEALRPGQRFDLVFANMLRTEFLPLRTATLGVLPPGGRLVLSGYLATEREQMLAWFDDAGLFLESELTEGEWWAAVARAGSDSTPSPNKEQR